MAKWYDTTEAEIAAQWYSRVHGIPIDRVRQAQKTQDGFGEKIYRLYQQSLGPTRDQLAQQRLQLWQGNVTLPGEPGSAEFDQSRNLIDLQVKTGGWSVPFDISEHIRSVVGKPNAFDLLVSKIVADPRFKRLYPGIFDSAGGLKMSPVEYRQRATRIREIGAQYGFNYTDQQIGKIINGDKSDSEVDFQAQAVQTLRNNSQVLEAFRAQVDDLNKRRKANGLPPIKNITTVKDAIDFIQGRSSSAVYSAYEAASVAAGAASAGISVSAERARRLAQARPGLLGLDETEKRYKEIADRLRTSGAELSAFGLSTADLETIEFGLPGAAGLAIKAERAMAQAEAQREVDIQGEQVQVGGRPQTRGFEPEGE